MPGAMSDADREWLSSMTPGIETTPQGRKMILDTARADKKYAQGLASAESKYLQDRRKNGEPVDPYDIEQFRMAYADANPRYQDLIAKYKTQPQQPAAPAPPAGMSSRAAKYFQ